MLSALTWIPRGAVSRVPQRQELSKEEIDAIKREAGDESNAAADDVMDDADDLAQTKNAYLEAKAANQVYLGAGGGGGGDEDEDEEEEEEGDDLEAKPSDAFVIVANTEDEYSSLEVHCYNETDGSLYVHHDITLPSYPLCLAWSDYAGDAAGTLYTQTGRWNGEPNAYVGSYCAVGTFEPNIEIWNMDVMDPLEPTLVLRGNKGGNSGSNSNNNNNSGGGGGGGKRNNKKNKDKKHKDKKTKGGADASGAGSTSSSSSSHDAQGHSDAVMGLSWNKTHRHLFASSSADCTVKIWDIDAGGKLLHTFDHHKGKVQQVSWNPSEASVIATASYDRTVSVTDAREGDAARIAFYALPADPESLVWNHLNPANFIVSTENGLVVSYDCRVPDTPLWTLKAHEQSVPSLALSSTAAGLLVTTSLDKSVKIWDVQALEAAGATAGGGNALTHTAPLARKSMSIGQIFTCSFFPNNPYLLACGGSKGMLAIWDISEDGGDGSAEAITSHFGSRVVSATEVPSLAIRQREDGQPIAATTTSASSSA